MQNIPTVTHSTNANLDSDDQLKLFAHNLAKTHTTTLEGEQSKKSDLLKELKNWELVLRNANAIFKAAPDKDAPNFPNKSSRAGEWMLDNFYIVKQTFRQIEEDLPASFLNQLPTLIETAPIETFEDRKAPPLSQPRILTLAREWIAYSQAQIDISKAGVFFQYYQQDSPLTTGELWALPIMLRIGILECLITATAELTAMDTPQTLIRVVFPELPNDTLVANCFLSLRVLSSADWQAFFEKLSLVEQILRTDPAVIYASMDFETRNSYRGVVEDLAKHSKSSEEQVALTAIELAGLAHAKGLGREAHVGYYLRDAGRAVLEKNHNYQPEFGVRLRRALLASPTISYLGSIAFFSVLFLTGLFTYAVLSGGTPSQLVIAGFLGAGLAVEAAVTLVHWNITHLVAPQSLPRMDFSYGIPSGNRTMVVVPTLLESVDELNHLLQELELYYLANPDPLLTYALLTDFPDASTENTLEDEPLLGLAIAGIKQLNKKYALALPFYLFHRQRQWNPSEGVWMGWERKRGKLADFNRLLLNLGETSYTTQVGAQDILSDIKYVITLDADTSLPQGSANRLIATLAHPLNHAEFSPDGHTVVAGYTILQPRVAIKPTSANRSLFSQIFAGDAGFDLYSFAVSDVYQDVFGEGSYIGKGIYDVAAFEHSLAGQVRQNTLLSHDLFEGSYGRAALVTDITLYEEYPMRFLAYARRLSRWIRGDWQLLPWLFPMVSTEGGLVRNRLSIINLWKIFDNLRRS